MPMNRLVWIFLVVAGLSLTSCTSGGGIGFLDDKGARKSFQEGELAFEAGHYDTALAHYQTFLGQAATSTYFDEALYKTGVIYRTTGKNTEAVAAFSRLVREFPKSKRLGDSMVELLTLWFNAGEMDAVISQGNDFIRTTQAKFIKPGLYLAVGDAYAAKNQHLAAARLYYRAFYTAGSGGDTAMAQTKLDRAVSYLKSGEIQELIAGVMDRPMMGFLLYKLGMTFKAEQNYDAALAVLSSFAEQFPEQARQYEEARSQVGVLSEQRQYAPYTIGCLLPLSGSHAVMGRRVLDAIELAVSQANQAYIGESFRLVVKDSCSDPVVAASAVEALDQEQVGVILGPLITAEAAAEQAQARHIPIMVFTQRDGITELGDYVFRHFLTPSMQVRTLAAVATQQLGVTQFAILYPDEPYGKRYMEAFRQAVEQAGGQIIGVESYDPDGVDFSAPVKKTGAMLARGTSLYPMSPQAGGKALFIPEAALKSGMLISQLAFHDVRSPYLLGTNLWHSTELLASSKNYMKKALIVDGFFPESHDMPVQMFVSAFQQTFNRTPDVIEAIAYDSVMMAVQAMRQQGSTESRWAVKDALLEIRNFEGVSGRTTVLPTGDTEKTLQVLQIQGGRFVPVVPSRPLENRSPGIWQ